VFVLSTILVATVFDSYRTYHRTLIKGHALHTMIALTAAFDCVDENDDGTIDYDEWCELMELYFKLTDTVSQLSPRAGLAAAPNRDKMKLLFSALDQNADGTISLGEFFNLLNALSLDIELQSQVQRDRLSRAMAPVVAVLRMHSKRVQAIVSSAAFELTILVVILVSIAFAVPDHSEFIVDTSEWVFVSIFIAEMLVKMAGFGVAG
jgi:hypothetical protein